MKHKRLLFICILAACIAFAAQAWAQQSAPTDVEAAPGNQSAAVSFMAPAAETGASITSYTVTASDGTKESGTASPIVVSGLTNGTAYTFTVTATNSLSHTSSPSGISNSVTPSATPLAAYAGTWYASAMVTGAGFPYGMKLAQTVNADGTFIMAGGDNSGSNVNENCSAWLFPYGLMGACGGFDFLCFGDQGGTVSACTGTLNSAAYLSVATKQGSNYSISNLAGTWYAEGLDNSTQGDSWEQGTATLAGTSLTASVTDSSNPTQTKTVLGTMSLASGGLLSFNCTSGCNGGNGAAEWYVDAGKNVAAGFSSYASDDVELNILTRKAASYSLADLAGFWAGNELRSDGTWRRMIIEINSDGSYTSWQVTNDGTTSPDYGNLAISADGVVSCTGSNCSGNLAVMDAGKTLMVGTDTRNSGAAYSITILTRAESLWPNAVAYTGGWMGLDWFGDFNVNSSPWIYHQTLGWLYPDLSGVSTDSIWFYDPQWDRTGGWWWTSSSDFPWIYSSTDGAWFYYDAADSTPGARYFCNSAGCAEH